MLIFFVAVTCIHIQHTSYLTVSVCVLALSLPLCEIQLC